MHFRIIAFLFTSLLPLGNGCTAYLIRPVSVHVRDAETKEPIVGAEVGAGHIAFLDFGLFLSPDDWRHGTTNEQGKLTLLFDPYKDNLNFHVSAKGYHEELYRSFSKPLDSRLLQRGWFGRRKDLVVDLYREPHASLELIIPDGYRGLIALRFSPIDHPSETAGQRHFIYHVPTDGIVDIKETGLLFRVGMKNVRARFSNGKRMQTFDLTGATGATDDPDGPMLHLNSPYWKENVFICSVGSFEEVFDMNTQSPERKAWYEMVFRKQSVSPK